MFNPMNNPRISNGMAGPNTQFTSLPKMPGAPVGPQVQPNLGGTGGTAINPVDRGDGKGVPLGPQVQPNVGGTGGTAINPVDRGNPLGPQVQSPAPQGDGVSPGRNALIRSVMARAGSPAGGGMGNYRPPAGRPMAPPVKPQPRNPIFKPPGG